MKKILVVLFILMLCLSGCTEKKLASLVNDDVAVYNVQNGFDADSMLKDIKEGTEINTELDRENSELIITLTNGDTTQTLIKKVEIQEPLSTVNDISDMSFNGYNFDVNDVISDVKEGTAVNWTIEGDELTITLKNGEQTDVIKKQIDVYYPLGWFTTDNIVVDTYYGYDLNEIVGLAEGAHITSDSLDDDTLTVIVSDGSREETLTANVEYYDSIMYFDVYMTLSCGITPLYDRTRELALYPDGRLYTRFASDGSEYIGTWDETRLNDNDEYYTDDLVIDSIEEDWSKIYAHDVGLCLSGMPTSFELVRVYK